MFGAFLRGCISYFVHHQYPSNQPTTPPLNKCRSETMFVTPGSFDIPTEWAQDICKKLHAMGYKNQAGLHPEFCVCFGMFLIGKAYYLPIFLVLIWGEGISTRQNVFPRHFPWRHHCWKSGNAGDASPNSSSWIQASRCFVGASRVGINFSFRKASISVLEPLSIERPSIWSLSLQLKDQSWWRLIAGIVPGLLRVPNCF